MAKRFFYVKSDTKKSPVDLSTQAKGTELVCVTPTGEEVNFKVGEKFTNNPKKLTESDLTTDPEAIAYAAEEAQVKAARTAAKASAKGASTLRAASPSRTMAVVPLAKLTPEEKASKIAAAKAKAFTNS